MSNVSVLKRQTFASLDSEIKDLLLSANAAREFAYAPYSKFKVGASLLSTDGTVYTGCNVENASSVGICAERTAYVKAVSEGKKSFKFIAVIAFQENFVTPPCGACLQFMTEFGNLVVYLSKPNLEEVFVATLDDLMPCKFQHNSDFSF